jgi:5-methylcytosine-specific restriction endonuclease McrA
MAVPKVLSQAIRSRAHGRCQYCLMHESLQGATFHIEHVVPKSKGGESTLENLALACPGCNLHKAGRTTAVDPMTGEQVPLFHLFASAGRNTSDSKAMKWRDTLRLAAQRWRCSI